MTIIEIIAIVLMSAGFVFMLISALGLFLFPDFYTRLHSTGIGDTLGSSLILLGMAIVLGLKLISVKLLLIPLILLITGPLATNLILSATVHKHNYLGFNDKHPSKESLDIINDTGNGDNHSCISSAEKEAK